MAHVFAEYTILAGRAWLLSSFTFNSQHLKTIYHIVCNDTDQLHYENHIDQT